MEVDMLASRLTQKCQATIPAKVRKVLGVKAGDMIAFEVEDGKVVIHPVHPLDVQYAKAAAATLGEWESREDEEAYGEL
jgi:antitoxin PrlF